MKIIRTLLILIIGIILSGCDRASQSSSPTASLPNFYLKDGSKEFIRLGEEFSVYIVDAVTEDEDTVWIVSRVENTPPIAESEFFRISRVNVKTMEMATLDLESNEQISQLFLQDNQIRALAYRQDQYTGKATLNFIEFHFSSLHQIERVPLHTIKINETNLPTEKYYFTETTGKLYIAFTKPLNGLNSASNDFLYPFPSVIDETLIKVQPLKDGNLVVANYYLGYYALYDKELNFLWAYEFSRPYKGSYRNLPAFYAQDENENYCIYSSLYEKQTLVHNKIFGHRLGVNGLMDLVKICLNPVDGSEKSINVLDSSIDYFFQLLPLEKDTHGFFGAILRPGQSEYDIFYKFMSPSQAFERIIDIDNEDRFSSAIMMQNQMYVSGTRGYHRAKTQSITSYGYGFIDHFDQNGIQLNSFVLKSNRHTSVDKILTLNKNFFVAIGSYDAPITHTADNNPSLGYAKSFLILFKLDENGIKISNKK